MCVHMYHCVLGVVFLCALKEMSVCVCVVVYVVQN